LRPLIAAGEFFFDLIFYRLDRLPRMGEELVTPNFALALGGGAPNTAITAARLGRKVELAAVLGDTSLDQFAIGELKKNGVGTRLVRRQAKTMGALTVAVSLPKDRFFLTYAGSNGFLDKYLLSTAARTDLASGAHVHFGLSPRDWKPYAKLVTFLKKQGVTTSWDLGWHPEAVQLPGFRELYAALDVVFLNKIEALRYAEEKNVEKAMRKLASPGQVIVVKLGGAGAVALGPGGLAKAASLKVEAVDTTGAGDAFNGGFLHVWLEGAGLVDCLRAGNVCGALSTTQPGGNAGVPDHAQLKRALREMK
jgi:sugar/nucleoside kinase (ribokinase family)